MNNEKYNQIIESAWKKYADSHYTPGNPNSKLLSEQLPGIRPMMHNRETFKKEIIKNPIFASQWGLKIEERELSHDERFEIYKKISGRDLQPHISGINFKKFHFDESNIPTKLITVTHNNETIAVYE